MIMRTIFNESESDGWRPGRLLHPDIGQLPESQGVLFVSDLISDRWNQTYQTALVALLRTLQENILRITPGEIIACHQNATLVAALACSLHNGAYKTTYPDE